MRFFYTYIVFQTELAFFFFTLVYWLLNLIQLIRFWLKVLAFLGVRVPFSLSLKHPLRNPKSKFTFDIFRLNIRMCHWLSSFLEIWLNCVVIFWKVWFKLNGHKYWMVPTTTKATKEAQFFGRLISISYEMTKSVKCSNQNITRSWNEWKRKSKAAWLFRVSQTKAMHCTCIQWNFLYRFPKIPVIIILPTYTYRHFLLSIS